MSIHQHLDFVFKQYCPVCQSVHDGRNQISIYICSGTFDSALNETKVKQNYFSMVLMAISFLWCSFAAVKITRYKRSIQGIAISFTNYRDAKTKLALMLKETFQMSLVNIAMLAFGFFTLLVSVTIPAYLSTLDPTSFNISPNYQLYHFSNHGFILLTYAVCTFIYYSGNEALRQVVFREIKDELIELNGRV